jgi:Tol biopolymer transport system component
MPDIKKSVITSGIILPLIAAMLFTSCAGYNRPYQPSDLPGRLAITANRDKGAHIWTTGPAGNDLQPTSTDNGTVDFLPAWSPDGARIVFGSNQSGSMQIWSMNADGSDRRRITDKPGWNGLPAWSPDGGKIAFVGEVMDDEGIRNLEVFSINPDGSGLKQLTDITSTHDQPSAAGEAAHSDRTGWNSVPAWSPDGSKILFSSNRDGDGRTPILYIMNADGSGQQKFGMLVTIDGTEPDWSAANNKIVFVRGTAAKGDIWVMDAGSPLPLMTAKKLTDNIDNNRSPVWSPDGRQIAFTSDEGNVNHIFIMNADGSNIHRLTADKTAEVHAAWR